MGQNRSIVSDVAGTTRDSVDTYFNAFDKEMILVDTAGLRKRKQMEGEERGGIHADGIVVVSGRGWCSIFRIWYGAKLLITIWRNLKIKKFALSGY